MRIGGVRQQKHTLISCRPNSMVPLLPYVLVSSSSSSSGRNGPIPPPESSSPRAKTLVEPTVKCIVSESRSLVVITGILFGFFFFFDSRDRGFLLFSQLLSSCVEIHQPCRQGLLKAILTKSAAWCMVFTPSVASGLYTQ